MIRDLPGGRLSAQPAVKGLINENQLIFNDTLYAYTLDR